MTTEIPLVAVVLGIGIYIATLYLLYTAVRILKKMLNSK